MYCEFCGKQIDEGTAFCPYCGQSQMHQAQHQYRNADSAAPDQMIQEQEYKTAGSKKVRARYIVVPLMVFFLIAGAVCIILYSLGFFQADEEMVAEISTEILTEESDPESSDDVETYENGDTVYIPSEENLAVDEAEGVVYYENLLNVYTLSDLSEEDAAELAAQVDGTVVGDISGAVNFLQIQVESIDLSTLNSYAEILMASDDVLYASYDIPMIISNNTLETDNNPWTDEENGNGEIETIAGKGEEDNPDGNDWWAEAIGAYTAWNYVDGHEDELADITVGILDSGFDIDHEDLSGIQILNANSAADHGTHVAGIISATNNDIGIRGIADVANIISVDWSETNTDENGQIITTNLLSTGAWVEYTKQLYEAGAQVINNSWAYKYSSEEMFYSNELTDGEKLYASTYEEYEERYLQSVHTSAVQTIMLLVELQLCMEQNGDHDFLIIQAAGNGLDNGGMGIVASNAGFYAAVTEENYQLLSEETREKLEVLGCAYSTLREHIIIVGAVHNEKDDFNCYEMTTFSNYGLGFVDICAPGWEIFSTLTLLDDEEDQDENGNPWDDENDEKIYGTLSGTSMAAPMVTAAVALVWSVDSTLSAAEVKNILTTNIVTYVVGVTGDDTGVLYPMLDVGRAVLAAAGDGASETIDDEQIWQEFLSSGGYLEYTDSWEKSRYGTTTGWEKMSPEYVIIDINADGVKELLIQTTYDSPFYTTWTFALSGSDIVFVGGVYGYGSFRYSSSLNAVVVSPEFRPFDGTGSYPFYQLKDMEYVYLFQICQDEGIWYYADADGSKQTISDDERESYFADAESFEWKEMDSIFTDSIFELLPENFTLSSGAGNWSDEFKLSADGTFVGRYSDLNMGDYGEGYSGGTISICDYEGKFSLVQKLDDYRYLIKVECLNMTNEAGTIYYEDDFRYICFDSSDLNYGDELIVYLPGCPLSDMAEEYVSWWKPMLSLSGDTWPDGYYGIYNTSEEIGFYGYKE